jgi:hypothetical protein
MFEVREIWFFEFQKWEFLCTLKILEKNQNRPLVILPAPLALPPRCFNTATVASTLPPLSVASTPRQPGLISFASTLLLLCLATQGRR